MESEHAAGAKANRNYKDSLFRAYFKEPKNFIDAGNAIMGTNYGEDTVMEDVTLENALFMDQINDVSFLIDGKLVVFVEHQSYINNNMPLRMLFYASRVYERLVDSENIYACEPIGIPRAEFYVLYNGRKPLAPGIMRLSDMYRDRAENKIFSSGLELTVAIYNISSGCDQGLLEKSRALCEYETLVELIRGFEATHSLDDAITLAVAECERRGIMVEFLKIHGPRLRNMIYTQWNTEKAKEVWHREGVEMGVKMGAEKERRKTAIAMKAKGLAVNTIAEITGLTVDDILRL